MVSKIRFSIIIPTYNREIYLLDAVRSAVNASPANAEIIIVNDGDDFSETTKNVLDTLNAFTLKTVGGIGAGAARNQGAKQATGQWLLFLDDDDLIAAGYWQLVSEFLLQGDETHYRSYGFCHATTSKNREEMHLISNRKATNASCFLEEKNLLRSKLAALSRGFWLSALIFKEVGGIDPQLRVNEDTDLCLKLIASGAKCYVNSFNGAIIYKGPRGPKVSKSVTKAHNAIERASYFKRIIDKHTKLLADDSAANKWIWKRYLKMAARAKKQTAIAELAENKTLTLKSKLFLGVYWYGVFLLRL